jgi:hypothetical protein
MRIEERLGRHSSFLPQKVVQHEVWIGDLKKGMVIDDDLHT